MEESCFCRVSLCDRLFGRARSLSSQDRAHAARAPPSVRRGQGLGLGHRRDLRQESGLRKMDSLCSELRKMSEKRNDIIFCSGRTHLGWSVGSGLRSSLRSRSRAVAASGDARYAVVVFRFPPICPGVHRPHFREVLGDNFFEFLASCHLRCMRIVEQGLAGLYLGLGLTY